MSHTEPEKVSDTVELGQALMQTNKADCCIVWDVSSGLA